MPDLRLYRVALVIAVILAAASLLALKSPQTIALSTQPTAFDGQARHERHAGRSSQTSPAGSRSPPPTAVAAGWVARQLAADGLTHAYRHLHGDHRRPSRVAEQRVGGLRRQRSGRDRGARAARLSALCHAGRQQRRLGHRRPARARLGVLGRRPRPPASSSSRATATPAERSAPSEFLDHHRDLPILAVVALRRVAGRDVRAFTLNGWGTSPLLAPPWLWSLGRAAGRTGGELHTPLPPVTSQILRLAIPGGGGSQAPFVAAGLAAIELSAPGPPRPAVADTLDSVSTDTLARSGRAAELLVDSLDGAPQPLAGSGQTVFFSRFRQLTGGFVVWILAVLGLPLALVTVDLVRRRVKRRLPLSHALLRLALRAAPWLLHARSRLPRQPAVAAARRPRRRVSPDAVVSHAPRYLRVVLILLFLALAYHYAMAIERRLARRYPADTRGGRRGRPSRPARRRAPDACRSTPSRWPSSCRPLCSGRSPGRAPGCARGCRCGAASRWSWCPRLLRRAAAPGLGGLVVFLPVAGDPRHPGRGGDRGGRRSSPRRPCWDTSCTAPRGWRGNRRAVAWHADVAAMARRPACVGP